MKNVKYGKCVRCGKTYESVPTLTNCTCGGILDIVYDYGYIKSVLSKEKLAARENRSMWRYRELLPVEETTADTPLRVGWSPLYDEPKLAEMLGIKKLWVKDDGQNPTASLRDRASAMAVAKALEAGAETIACSSTGNAASSLAGNAAAAGLKTYIFVPERAPKGKVAQLMIFGANVISVKGNYEDTFKMSAEAIDKYGWYNRNAAINPYLSEGKKTVALEIAEQLNWEMPDYLAISVGDGCTIAGVWKGLKDLYAIGFIDKLPRLISAQAEGCHPINRAIAENKPWEPMEEDTLADSIAVGVPRNADKALMAIRESNGIVVNVTDEEIMAAAKTAQAADVIEGKGGLDYEIEQGGKNLSGGQRQRFTIARALVRKPEILILDDSASALDFATDAALRKAIREMDSDPTVFIVSQRTSSIQHADKIIVLDDGKIVGIGRHDELLENCPVYSEIYNSQFKKEAV